MAAAATLSLSLDHHHLHLRHLFTAPIFNAPAIAPRPKPHLPKFSKVYGLVVSFPASYSHSSPPVPPPSSNSEIPFRPGRFLSNDEHEKLQFVENFEYFYEIQSGSLRIRLMRADEIDFVAELLAESFAESIFLPGGYVSLLRFLVKQYLMEKRSLMPHAATLIGFFREKEGVGEEVLAGTVEVSFDRKGANASPPSPTAPKDSPYICNMTVKSTLRRRGIGWHLLKASEELIYRMGSAKEVYLHCRTIDAAPFNMYVKAGYTIVKTDNILILLMLQRRKHLMYKKLTNFDSPSEKDCLSSNEASS